MTRQQIAPVLKALAAAMLFGINAPLSKLLLAPSAVGEVAPIPMAALLYLGSGLGALVLLAVQRRGQAASPEARLQRGDVPWLAGALLAGGVAAPIVLMAGLRVTPGATAALLLNFEGVATTLIAVLAFREAIGRRVWGTVGLVTVASAVLSWEPGARFGVSLGALGVLAACLLWGVDNNLTRNISARNPLTIVAVKGLGAGAVSLVLALLAGQPLPGSSAPFIGALVAFVVLGETVGTQFLIALPLMLAGTALLVTERHGHVHRHSFVAHEHRHRHDDGHHDHVHGSGGVPPAGWHSHPHEHTPQTHEHPHTPDLHHRHGHAGET